MGDASDEEVATLSEWIAESSENAQAFALLAAQDAYLATAVANKCQPEAHDAVLLQELAALEQAAGPAELVDLTHQVEAQKRLAKQQALDNKRSMYSGDHADATRKQPTVLIVPKAAVWVGLAAVVVLAATLLFYVSEPAGDQGEVASTLDDPQMVPADLPVFAGIVRSLDAQWQDGERRPSHLKQGEHTLAQGMVELELLSGTRIVVEAPATFELTGINTMAVSNGSAVFAVPGTSASFILDTPSARFIIGAALSSAPARFMQVSQRQQITEFGVNVEGTQQTHAQVFRGKVYASAVQDESQDIAPITLGESQGVVISSRGIQDVVYDELAFARVVTKQLELADLIMGGDGTTQRKEVGLHPVTGMHERSVKGNRSLVGLLSTGRLQPVPDSTYVTGTFIPSKDGRLVGLPAGLTLPGLPETNGLGYGVIWSGDEMPSLNEDATQAVPTKLPGYNFAGAGQQSLVMHTNAGVMIDLDSIRDANAGFEVVAIKAVVGNSSNYDSSVPHRFGLRSEFLAYLDSDLVKRQLFDLADDSKPRVVTLDLPIEETNRYLTLISADGGDGNHQDWLVIGNPIVVLQPIEKLTDDF